MEITILFLLLLLHLLVLKSQSPLTVGNFISSQETTQSHEHERLSLLKFKESFILNSSTSYVSGCAMIGFSKVETWIKSEDCCSWKGVLCDTRTGHVISLDLSCSSLYGSLNSTSSLFNLVHLRRLDLSGNDFNFSQIPSEIGNLSKLTHLDLSNSFFSGEIPSEISKLSKLVDLSLCCNYDDINQRNLLALKNLNLISFVKNLTSLQVLSLANVDIMSPVPSIIANRSSLTFLCFQNCGLNGEFPFEIFHLPKLSYLDMQSNLDLTGHLPDFHSISPLQTLFLGETSFGGKLPTSIGYLKSLEYMDLMRCNFSGFIPPSLSNLTQLIELFFGYNSFSGNIPSSFANMTQLSKLHLGSNRFYGPLSRIFSSLKNLEYLALDTNDLHGNLEMNLFWKLKNLFALFLSDNKFSLQTEKISNLTLPKIQALGIASCNLNYFPSFLSFLVELEWLDISSNRISTPLPLWLWNSSFKKLQLMNFSHNALTGELSHSICKLESLEVLDLTHNVLEGSLPQCLGSLSQSLTTLRLSSNRFVGVLPEIQLKKSCSLIEMDLSQNFFQARVPRSWISCTDLEYIDLSYNQISDEFPYWLGSLPNLKILLLRSNAFHGTIGKPEENYTFSNLHIIDLSLNGFSGLLPSEYFKLWNSMKIKDMERLHFGRWKNTLVENQMSIAVNFPFSVTISIKGIQMAYDIQKLFYLMVIDLSSNKFVGTIPEFIGDLVGLHALNLSNNMLSGTIPSSLSKIKDLESLDLSNNSLSGMIPQQLTDLTFLADLDVSHNNLVGPIPHGTQFDTFGMSSFEGNPGLCGDQLKNKCGALQNIPHPPSSFDDDEDKGGLFRFDWIVAVIGYGSGLVIGVVIGSTSIDIRKFGWLTKTSGRA